MGCKYSAAKKPCPGCGAKCDPDVKSCPSCGQKLGVVAGVEESIPLAAYVSKTITQPAEFVDVHEDTVASESGADCIATETSTPNNNEQKTIDIEAGTSMGRFATETAAATVTATGTATQTNEKKKPKWNRPKPKAKFRGRAKMKACDVSKGDSAPIMRESAALNTAVHADKVEALPLVTVWDLTGKSLGDFSPEPALAWKLKELLERDLKIPRRRQQLMFGDRELLSDDFIPACSDITLIETPCTVVRLAHAKTETAFDLGSLDVQKPPILGFRASCRWIDQSSGKLKGRIKCMLYREGVVVHSIDLFGMCQRDHEVVWRTLTRNDGIVALAQPRDVWRFRYEAGCGGGHTFDIWDFCAEAVTKGNDVKCRTFGCPSRIPAPPAAHLQGVDWGYCCMSCKANGLSREGLELLEPTSKGSGCQESFSECRIFVGAAEIFESVLRFNRSPVSGNDNRKISVDLRSDKVKDGQCIIHIGPTQWQKHFNNRKLFNLNINAAGYLHVGTYGPDDTGYEGPMGGWLNATHATTMPTLLDDGLWHHIEASYIDGTLECYIDGRWEFTKTGCELQTGGDFLAVGESFWMDIPQCEFHGELRNLMVYFGKGSSLTTRVTPAMEDVTSEWIGAVVGVYQPTNHLWIQVAKDGTVTASPCSEDHHEWIPETFKLTDLGGGCIGLFELGSKRFLQICSDGKIAAVAKAQGTPTTSEMFRVYNVVGGHIGLYSATFQRWIHLSKDGVSAFAQGPDFEPEWIGEALHFEVAVSTCTVSNPPEEHRSYSTKSKGVGLGSMLDAEKAWLPTNNKSGEWMQIDLGFLHEVEGTVVQGRADSDQRVTSYLVKYSADAVQWHDVGHFNGAVDRNSLVRNSFRRPVQARYIRLEVVRFHGHVAMRAGILCRPRAPSLIA